MTYLCAWCGVAYDVTRPALWVEAQRAGPLHSHGICPACFVVICSELGVTPDELMANPPPDPP